MVRRWVVEASAGGEVSRDEMREAFMDAEAILARQGGVLSVVVSRAQTDMPLEMVTTRAVFEWKDRTDAKMRPEEQLHVISQDELEALFAEAPDALEVDTGDAEDDEDEIEPLSARASADDLEAAELAAITASAPEVDESSVPEALRG